MLGVSGIVFWSRKTSLCPRISRQPGRPTSQPPVKCRFSRARTEVLVFQSPPYSPVRIGRRYLGLLRGKISGLVQAFPLRKIIYQLYQQNIYNEANVLYALDMSDAATGD